MSSIPETDPEDLKLFVVEADEQLQLLDAAIVKMESDGADADLLQEIFRAAHTLKGSSAMLGYQKMTQLAHAMESLLDLVRTGELPVTTPLVDGLLHGLDGLSILKDDLVDGQDSGLDIGTTVAELEDLAGVLGEAESTASPAGQLQARPLFLNEEALKTVDAPRADGEHIFKVSAHFTQDSMFLSIRSFQVLGEMSGLGEVLASSPTQEEIEQEKAGPLMQVVLMGNATPDAIKAAVESVEDVESAEVEDFVYEPPTEMPEPEPVAAVAPAVETEPAATTEQDSGAQKEKSAKSSQTVRIDVERLDSLMNAIGELVIDRTRMQQISRDLEAKFSGDQTVANLGSTFTHTSRLIGDIQEEIMKARMVPISTVFNSFPRMIRDLSQSLGKPVEFTMDGQETEIDRTVVENIRDPLVHLLRNGLDHGLETPDERREANKPEKGCLKLAAFQEQGQIVITVTDDGKGIDPEKVKASALSKGLYTAEAVARMTDSEAIDLIFAPGMSTKEATTEVSGRGVGMDIVKTNIEKVRGSIGIETQIGSGSTFIIKLPLTLAIIQGILVKAKGKVYAIPLVYILETFRVDREEVHTIGGAEFIRRRESVFPLFDLNNMVSTSDGSTREGESQYAVLVRQGERSIAIGVDTLLEPQEIVVKSLGEYMGNVKGISGASILGDGQVVLILDIPTMITEMVTNAAAVAV